MSDKKTVSDFLKNEPDRVEGRDLMELLAAIVLRAGRYHDQYREQQEVALQWLVPVVAQKWWVQADERPLLAAYREWLSESQGRQFSSDEAMQHLAAVGIYLALDDADRPQRIRFGKTQYLYASMTNEKVPELIPSELPVTLYMRWLLSRSVAGAERHLRDEPFPLESGGNVEWVDTDPDALGERELEIYEVLTAAASREERMLEEAVAVASPRQLQILLARQRLGPDTPWQRIAEEVGVSVNQAKVQWSRLRKKLRTPEGDP